MTVSFIFSCIFLSLFHRERERDRERERKRERERDEKQVAELRVRKKQIKRGKYLDENRFNDVEIDIWRYEAIEKWIETVSEMYRQTDRKKYRRQTDRQKYRRQTDRQIEISETDKQTDKEVEISEADRQTD